MKNNTFRVILAGILATVVSSANAIPALQLGPDPAGNWAYDISTQTWVTTDDPFVVNAFANDDTAAANGSYAWDQPGSNTQIAYLILAATSKTNIADGFDVTVMNDGAVLTELTSGFGTPPIQDPNSIGSHGIFDTYFEIYQFNFNGMPTTISDQEPGQTGTGSGFIEAISVDITNLFGGVTGIHLDLFTVEGTGALNPSGNDKDTVKAFAPFSHDAEYNPTGVPEPGSLMLLLGLDRINRRSQEGCQGIIVTNGPELIFFS